MKKRTLILLGLLTGLAPSLEARPGNGNARGGGNLQARGHAASASRAAHLRAASIRQPRIGSRNFRGGTHLRRTVAQQHVSRRFSSHSWSRRDHHHDHRDCHEHHRIVFLHGGYYFYHEPFWYPAYDYYGYDDYAPAYVSEPVYQGIAVEDDSLVAEVQRELRRDRYYLGPIDGIAGSGTRQALLAFQRDHRLPATGRIDRDTLEELDLD